MDGLRWLLLVFGLLAIFGVYLYSRREKSNEQDANSANRIVPSLDGNGSNGDAVNLLSNVEIAAELSGNGAGEADGGSSGGTTQKIITVRIVARAQRSFRGDELILSMRGIGLRHGKFGIFHRFDGNDETQTVFSAASLVEPGSFDLQNIKDQEIPGISLFLVLPGPIDSVEAFDLMMTAARALTQTLDGELLDESGSTMSIQRERYLREDIIQFQHSNLVT